MAGFILGMGFEVLQKTRRTRKPNARALVLTTSLALLIAVSTVLTGCGGSTHAPFSGAPANGTPMVNSSGATEATTTTTADASTTTVHAMTASSSLTAATTTTTALPWVRGVSFSPATVGSGGTSTGTVTLSAAAPSTGATVSLTTNKATIATIPTSVLVPAGQTTGTFPIRIGTVSYNTYVTISAAYNNTYAGAYLMATPTTVTPPPTTGSVSISVSPTSASMVAGTAKQFVASVSGTTNTAVTWKASAGTVSYYGVFTAPAVTATTTVSVTATSQADPTKTATALISVSPATVTPPPPTGGTGTYSGSGPVASWKAYQYRDTDGKYHQAIRISGATATYPVIGYSYTDSACTHLGDKFNDWWQPLGNGLWWFINFPDYVHVKWVWYDNATNKNILQQTPCIDYSGAPKYN